MLEKEDGSLDRFLAKCISDTTIKDLTLPMPEGRGFLVAAESYRLTSSFLIGRTPS